MIKFPLFISLFNNYKLLLNILQFLNLITFNIKRILSFFFISISCGIYFAHIKNKFFCIKAQFVNIIFSFIKFFIYCLAYDISFIGIIYINPSHSIAFAISNS